MREDVRTRLDEAANKAAWMLENGATGESKDLADDVLWLRAALSTQESEAEEWRVHAEQLARELDEAQGEIKGLRSRLSTQEQGEDDSAYYDRLRRKGAHTPAETEEMLRIARQEAHADPPRDHGPVAGAFKYDGCGHPYLGRDAISNVPGCCPRCDPHLDEPDGGAEYDEGPGDWLIQRGVTCVVCPGCAFTFDEGHEDSDPQNPHRYSCPNCGHNERTDNEGREPDGCPGCAKGEAPVMLDDDGTFCSVSSRPGRLGHAIDDYWWYCDDYARAWEVRQEDGTYWETFHACSMHPEGTPDPAGAKGAAEIAARDIGGTVHPLYIGHTPPTEDGEVGERIEGWILAEDADRAGHTEVRFRPAPFVEAEATSTPAALIVYPTPPSPEGES